MRPSIMCRRQKKNAKRTLKIHLFQSHKSFRDEDVLSGLKQYRKVHYNEAGANITILITGYL